MSHHDTESQVKLLDQWLVAEDDTIAMTNKISASTKNDTIKIFMDIIRTDSAKHKRIQEFLKAAMTVKAPSLSFGEISEISGMINEHLALEQKTVDLGKELVAEMKLPVIKELFQYLLDDEEKHVRLLNSLAAFKEFAQKNT
jgi:hypothetical protein